MSSTTREQAKARSRQALIGAGMQLFRDQGLDGPSLDAICKEAGYTRGAFYGHFADRDAFMVAVMKEIGGPIVETLAGGNDADGLIEITARFIAAFADGTYPLAPKGGIRPHQLFAACSRSSVLRSHYAELIGDAIAKLHEAIANDQERGRLRADLDPGAVATGLLVLVVGAGSLAEIDVPIDLAGTSQTFVAMLALPRSPSKKEESRA